MGLDWPTEPGDGAACSPTSKTSHASTYGTSQAIPRRANDRPLSSLAFAMSPPEKPPPKNRPVAEQNADDQPREMRRIGDRPDQPGHAQHQKTEHHCHTAGRDEKSCLGIELALHPGISEEAKGH